MFFEVYEWWCIWYQGESFYNPYIPGVLEKLDNLGLIEESDGARVIYVEENTRIMYEQTKSMLNAYDDAMTHAKCEAGIW